MAVRARHRDPAAVKRAARPTLAAIVAAASLAACTTAPPPPDWQVEAHAAIERALAAYLDGNAPVEAAEAARAHRAAAATGRPTLVARIELMRCAARVASLEFGPCAGFEAWRADAAEPERAYADYLGARATPAQAGLLPAAQRGAASASADASAQALAEIADPLSRLVAAGVMFESGRASPAAIALAADTASAQGWRRPLLAWLGVQRGLAERAGDAAEVQRLQRRIDLASGRP
jgi:hypothetical protein